MFDGESFGEEIVASVKAHVASSIAPLLSEITALKAKVLELESREPLRDEKGERGLPGENIKGDKGDKGDDGVGIASSFIDREGNLVLTFTDGTVGSVGKVVGDRGKDADRNEIKQLIAEEVSKFPKPKDGRDGFGFEDLKVIHDGERKFTLQFQRGDEIREFPFDLAIPIDRGVWREGKHQRGDGVSSGGSFWIAQRETMERPDQGSKDWRLAVKRGRDGKDGKGEKGDKGDPGRDGHDLTQMDSTGLKWGR